MLLELPQNTKGITKKIVLEPQGYSVSCLTPWLLKMGNETISHRLWKETRGLTLQDIDDLIVILQYAKLKVGERFD